MMKNGIQGYNYLKMCALLASSDSLEKFSTLITYILQHVFCVTQIPVREMFKNYCNGKVILYTDMLQNHEHVWTKDSLKAFLQDYQIIQFIPVQEFEKMWQNIRSKEIPQQEIYEWPKSGFLDLKTFNDLIQSRNNIYQIKSCQCRERADDGSIIHNYQTNEGNCLMQLSKRCDVRIKIPNVVKEEIYSSFFFKTRNALFDVIGEGFPLYFGLLKFSIVLLVVMFLTSGGFNLISNNFLGTACVENQTDKHTCQFNWITRFSLLNKSNNYDINELQNNMTLFSILCIAILFQYWVYQQRLISTESDLDVVSRGDFTIYLSDIKIHEKIRKSLKKDYIYLQERINEHKKIIEQGIKDYINNFVLFKYQVKTFESESLPEQNINIIFYNISGANWTYNAFVNLEYKAQKAIFFHKELNFFTPKSLANQQYILINRLNNNKLVYFYLVNEKKLILNSNHLQRDNGKYKMFKNTYVSNAYEPQEYIWENFTKVVYVDKLKSILIVLGCLLVSFVVIVFTDYFQQSLINWIESPNYKFQYVQESKQTEDIYIDHIHNKVEKIMLSKPWYVKAWNFCFELAISQSVAWIILFLNNYLGKVMDYANDIEHHKRKTQRLVSQANKNILLQFFNTTIYLFLINVIWVWITDGIEAARAGIYENGGLVYNINFLIINNALKDPLMGVIQRLYDLTGNVVKIKSGWKFLSYITCSFTPNYTQGAKITQSEQKKLENLYLEVTPEYNMVEKYAWISNTLFLTIFYAPLLPVGFFWSFIGILLNYKLEKFILVNTVRIKNELTKEMSEAMSHLLEYSMTLYIISNYIFYYLVVHGTYFDGEGNKVMFGASVNSENALEVILDMFSKTNLNLWLGISFGIAYLFLDLKKLNEILFPVQDIYSISKDNISFEEAQAILYRQKDYINYYDDLIQSQQQEYVKEQLWNQKKQETNSKEEIQQYINKMIPSKQPYLYDDLNFISWPEEEDLVTLDKKQNIREFYIQEQNKSFFSLERYLGNLFEKIQMPIFYHNSEILPAEFTEIINQIKQVNLEQYISKFENFLPIQNQQSSLQQTQEIEIQQNKLEQNEQQIKVQSQQDVQKKHSQDYDYKNLLIYTLKQCYINHKKYI